MSLAYPRDSTLGNLWELNKLGSLPLGSVIFRTIFQLEGKRVGKIYTVELWFNKPLTLYNEVLSITNDFLYPSDSKIYGKEPRYNETLLQRTLVASPLAFRYIEVPLWFTILWLALGPTPALSWWHISDKFRSGKLPTYPSPKLTLTFVSDLGQNVHYRSVPKVFSLTKYY